MRNPQDDAAIHVSEADLELLRALALGGKDEVVARRLGIAPRTLRRRLLDLANRWGVTSRFQAGVFAASAGLVACDVLLHKDGHREAAVADNPHYPYESAEEKTALRARRHARGVRDELP